MSRRGARRIAVGPRRFRWKLNVESPQTLALLVEPEEPGAGGGSLLEVQLPDELYDEAVTPRLVEQIVVAAIALGWEPEDSPQGQLWRWEGGELRRLR